MTYIHDTSIVEKDVFVGEDTKIWQWCHISSGVVIGYNCVLGQGVYVGEEVIIGNGCKLENNVSVFKGVTLGDEVFCGPSCVFTNVKTPRAHISRRDQYVQTLVKKRASIGANATILCGITIGEYAMIAAGAVVTHDVPAHGIMVGNPARRIGWACECGVTLENVNNLSPMFRCKECALVYYEKDGELHSG